MLLYSYFENAPFSGAPSQQQRYNLRSDISQLEPLRF